MISTTSSTRRILLLALGMFVVIGVCTGGVAAAEEESPFEDGDIDISIESDRFLWEQEEDGAFAEHEQEIEVTIENNHDVGIVIDEVDEEFESEYDTVSVSPGFLDFTIGPDDEETIVLDVETADEYDDGEQYDLIATFDFHAEGDQNNQTSAILDEPLTFEYGTYFVVDDIDFGDVPIGTDESIEVDISEEWGNADPENIELQEIESDDVGAITIETLPESSFQAGTSTTAELSVDFPPTVTVGEEYTARYFVQDDRGGAAVFDATAVAVPVDLEPIRNEIVEYDSTIFPSELQSIASDSVEIIDNTDVTEINEDELYAVIRFSDGVLRYLESSDEVISHQIDGDYDAAQQDLVSAAVGFDAVREHHSAVPDSSATFVENDVSDHFETLLDEQETHYEQRLTEEDVTVIENATIHRQLEVIAEYSDNPDDAELYGSIADSAYNEYITAIETAEANRQSASEEWGAIENELLITPGGLPIMINPVSYSEFQDRSDAVLSELNESIAAYEMAGETSEALDVEEQHGDYQSDILIVQLSAAISGLILLTFVIGVVWHTASGMFQYVRDSQDAALGDFLH